MAKHLFLHEAAAHFLWCHGETIWERCNQDATETIAPTKGRLIYSVAAEQQLNPHLFHVKEKSLGNLEENNII